MKSDSFTFRASDATTIVAYRWLPDPHAQVKAIVQLSHGMAEHAARYTRFAAALVDAGYAVYANDHRGHGKTAGSPENLGHLADDKGWDKAVEDLHTLTGIIKKENPAARVVLFGHSMGSFLARHYAMLHGDEIVSLVLSGTAGDPGFGGKIALVIGTWEARRKGARAKSPLMDKLIFGMYNKAFRPHRTAYDWLSRDAAEVDTYLNDPFCGAIMSAGFYCDLLKGLLFINRSENTVKIPPALPLYLFSGADDPVGAKTPWSGKTHGVRNVYKSFLKAGIGDVTLKFYPNGRHEMLNEINRDEVFKDVIAWLDKHH